MMLLSESVTSSGTVGHLMRELFRQDYLSFAHTGHESWDPMTGSCNVTSRETLNLLLRHL